MLPISFPTAFFLSQPQFVSFMLMICFPNTMWRLWAPRFSQNGILCDGRILCQGPLFNTSPWTKGSDAPTNFPWRSDATTLSSHDSSKHSEIDTSNSYSGSRLSYLQYHRNYQPRFFQVKLTHTTGATSSTPPQFHFVQPCLNTDCQSFPSKLQSKQIPRSFVPRPLS
jgi:hypothetical protein